VRPRSSFSSFLLVAAAAAGPGTAASLKVVSGDGAASGPGSALRYLIEVERSIDIDRRRFARQVEAALSHSRSWGAGGRRSFQRVSDGRVSFRVTLATPSTTDALCRPFVTGGIFSCWNGGRAVINLWRWQNGAASYRDDRRGYRRYIVNHEVGHAFGHGHPGCPRAGVLAPVMMQQTKGVGSCRRNPWPHPHARRLPTECSVWMGADDGRRLARGRVRYAPGRQPILLRYRARGDSWQDIRTKTDALGRARVRLPASVRWKHELRLRFPQTATRRTCVASRP
jgi:hypothetical protein